MAGDYHLLYLDGTDGHSYHFENAAMSNEFIRRMEYIKITSSFIVKSFLLACTTTERTTASNAAMRGWMTMVERAHVEFGRLLPPSIVQRDDGNRWCGSLAFKKRFHVQSIDFKVRTSYRKLIPPPEDYLPILLQ
jgi:hypothetical protein